MLSICIPIYNFDCTALVNDLLSQMHKLGKEIELIVADDASDKVFQEKFSLFPAEVEFIQLKENVGRSRIRNLLGERAKHDTILFIDGDSSIVEPDLLQNYIDILSRKGVSKVICGGSIYQDKEPLKDYFLRWKYSKSRERKSVSFSKAKPYQSFTTNNFIIDKDTFLSILFDVRIEEYGHEDTLFGYELMKRNISIEHIKDVVLNGDLDKNEVYLEKVKASISNLLQIAKNLDFADDFIRLIPLLKIYFRLKLFGLEIILRVWFGLNRKRLERNFLAGLVNLMSFDFYRLGVLSSIFKKS